jgi:hypothetical protein
MATRLPSVADVVQCAVIKRGENSIRKRRSFVLQEVEFLENFVCVLNVWGSCVLSSQHAQCMWYGQLHMSYVSA